MSFQTVQQTEPLHSLFPFTPLCGSFCTNGAATTSKQSANFRQSGLVAIYLGKYSVFLQKGLLTSHWSCSSSPAFKWLWKSSCQNKHKVFFWLLLKDRLSTRNLLRRKTMVLDSYECELCNSRQEETLEHLFLRCPYAIACWNLINLCQPALKFQFSRQLTVLRDNYIRSFHWTLSFCFVGLSGPPGMMSSSRIIMFLSRRQEQHSRKNSHCFCTV